MKKIKVVIADDHNLIRRGFVDFIKSNDELELIGDSENGEKLLEMIQKSKPDIAVIDYQMPGMDGIETAVKAEKISPLTSSIILTGSEDEMIFYKAIDKGIKGYILKENTEEELLDAITTVNDGDFYICRKMHKYLVERNQIGKKAREEKPGIDNLTETERKVLSMVASNLSSKQIADELYVSKRTVQTHRYNICMKLNLKGNNALLLFALKNMHLFN